MKLSGEKINLRTIKISDAKSIYENINHPDVLRYLLVPTPYKFVDAKKFVVRTQKKWRKKEAISLGIEDKNSGQIIGMISINSINKEHRYGELGYWLGKKYHRQGIMGEALNMILAFAFKKRKVHCVWAGTFKENIASQKLLQKYGFKNCGVMKKLLRRNNRWNDDLRWQLLKEEYKNNF